MAGLTMDFKSGDDTAMTLDIETQDDTATEPTTDEKAVAMDKTDKGSDELVQAAAGEALAGAVASATSEAAEHDSKKVLDRRFDVKTDESRDALLTEFGKETLTDRYLLPGEGYQDLFARVADYFADDAEHAQRLYDYISNLWFMPATPVLSNGGTTRGLPISCYLNSVSDSLDGIVNTWNENVWLASRGGGIGTYWGNVRGIGEPVGLNGKTSGTAYQQKVEQIDNSRTLRVQFVATRAEGMSWDFGPEAEQLSLHPGETREMLFLAHNPTDRPMVAQAIPSVSPAIAAAYFHKTECFCFTQQVLQPGERVEMPVRFIVDPAVPAQVKHLTLAYTLFDVSERMPDKLAAAQAQAH